MTHAGLRLFTCLQGYVPNRATSNSHVCFASGFCWNYFDAQEAHRRLVDLSYVEPMRETCSEGLRTNFRNLQLHAVKNAGGQIISSPCEDPTKSIQKGKEKPVLARGREARYNFKQFLNTWSTLSENLARMSKYFQATVKQLP